MRKTGIVLAVAGLGLVLAGFFLWRHPGTDSGSAGSSRAGSGPASASGVAPAGARPAPQSASPSVPGDVPVASPSTAPEVMDPAERAAFIANERRELREHLRDLPYWMRISDRELEAFIHLRAEQIADRQGLSGAAERDALTGHEKEIRGFLGDERYGGWQQWTAAAIPRLWLESVNGQLPDGAAVRGASMRAASLAMADAERRIRQEWRSSWEGMNALADKQRDPAVTPESRARFAELIRRRNLGVLEAAAPHLSQKQLQVLTEFLIEDSRAVDAATRKGAGSGGGS